MPAGQQTDAPATVNFSGISGYESIILWPVPGEETDHRTFAAEDFDLRRPDRQTPLSSASMGP